MRLSRRSVMKAGLVAATAGATITQAEALAATQPVLVVVDSRIARSRALGSAHPSRIVDIAAGDAHLWRELRQPITTGRIVGVSRWSDLVHVRGLLEEQGKRLRSDTRRNGLHYWEMS